MSLARTLWTANADLTTAALTHPFVRGIADGSLPEELFAGYVAQDAFFLEAFARGYALGVARSPDRAGLDAFADLLQGVREELRLHAGYAARWGIDLAGVVPVPAGVADRYREWVDAYSTPEFEGLAGTVEGLLDRYAGDTVAVRETYRRAMRLEVAFFDAALAASASMRPEWAPRQ